MGAQSGNLAGTRGLPSLFPFARAFRNPARTRSTIRLRSNSAMVPRTVNAHVVHGKVLGAEINEWSQKKKGQRLYGKSCVELNVLRPVGCLFLATLSIDHTRGSRTKKIDPELMASSALSDYRLAFGI